MGVSPTGITRYSSRQIKSESYESVSKPIDILGRSFRLIFAEPGRTLKVIAPGVALVAVATAFLFGSLANMSDNDLTPPEPVSWPLVVVAIIVGLLGAMVFAIFWHRHALLEGDQREDVMRPTSAIYGAYFKCALIVGFVFFVVALLGSIATGFVVAILAAATGPVGAVISIILFLVLAIVLSWVLLRISLILPAAATGHIMTYSESWEATRASSRDIFWTAVLLGVINVVLEQLAQGLILAVPNLAIFFAVLQGLLQSLIYVSVLSTLYGHLVQGRPLT